MNAPAAALAANRMPTGACDCHAHIFGPFERYPLPPNPTYAPEPAPWSDYLKILKRLGCSRAVLVQPSAYGTDHSALLAALSSREFPLRGIALMDASTTDRQLEELHASGFCGVRQHLLPNNKEAVLAALPNLARRIKRFGWHLQFYVDAANIPDLDHHLDSLPVPIVIDHFGLVPATHGLTSPGFQSLLRLARSERCWFKLSAPYRISSAAPAFAEVTPLARALVEAAPDRCVWGADWPHPNASNVPDENVLVDLLAEWVPDELRRQKILVENPAKLYSF